MSEHVSADIELSAHDKAIALLADIEARLEEHGDETTNREYRGYLWGAEMLVISEITPITNELARLYDARIEEQAKPDSLDTFDFTILMMPRYFEGSRDHFRNAMAGKL